MNMHQQPTPLKNHSSNKPHVDKTRRLANIIGLETERTLERLVPLQYNQTSYQKFKAEFQGLKTSIVFKNSGRPVISQSAISHATADILTSVALNTPNLKAKLTTIQARMKKGQASPACQKIVGLTIDKIDDAGMIDPDELSMAIQKNKLRDVLKSLLIVVTAIRILDRHQQDSPRLANPFPKDMSSDALKKTLSYGERRSISPKLP